LGIICVLNGQLVEWYRFATLQRLIDPAEVAQQHAERPPVRDDVMHRQHEHVPLVLHPEQPCPKQRAGANIKGNARFPQRCDRDVRLVADLIERQLKRLKRRQYRLGRALPAPEYRAQYLVSVHHRL